MAPPSSPACVKVGLIGAGRRLRSVTRSLLAEAKGRLWVAAAYEPDPLACAEVLREFGSHVKLCASESEFMTLPELQWIFIGSFNCLHAEQAIQALRAGRNVFCEKPLATTLADCLRVRQVVKETGKTFSFGLVLRYSPFYQKIKEQLDVGALGTLISFEFNETLRFNHGGYIFGNWRRHRHLAGTHLLEKCCHDLDLANWFTGQRPLKAASFGGLDFFTPAREYHVERIGPNEKGQPAYQTWPDDHRVSPFSSGATIVDNQVAIIQYSGGVRATFHTNCNTGLPERRFYFCGTEGTLRADAQTGLVEYARIGHENSLTQIDTGLRGGHVGGDGVLARGLLATVLDGHPPLATVDDGVRACIAAFGLDEALDSGRTIDYQPYWDAVPDLQ